jgi:hypothetical protein
MRRVAASLTAGVAIVLIASTGAGAQGHHMAPDGCPPSGRHTVIAADAQAEVYGVRKNSETIEYRGCVYGHTRWFDVGGRSECLSAGGACAGTDHITLAGTLVARELSVTSPVLGTKWLVEVENLRNGRVLYKVPTGAPLEPEPKYVGVGEVETLVLNTDGAAAWVARDSERSSHVGSVDEVRYFDIGSVDNSGYHLLASGTDIDPHSLALVGGTLYWTQGGKPYSATLN